MRRIAPRKKLRVTGMVWRDGRAWITVGAVLAFFAVGAGAFASHGLKARLAPEMLAVFETGARYQMFHALALVACGLAAPTLRRGPLAWAAGLFVVGTLLFSGSLYLLAVTGVRGIGVVTPFGGTAWLVGWLAFAWAAWPERGDSSAGPAGTPRPDAHSSRYADGDRPVAREKNRLK